VVNAFTPSASCRGLAPGTFVFDAITRNVTFRPQQPTEAAVIEVIVPRLASVIDIAAGAHDVAIDGVDVAFARGDLSMCLDRSCDGQSAAAVTSAAVEVHGAERVTIANSRVEHTGAWGVWVTDGSVNVTLSSIQLADAGTGGVRIGENRGGAAPPDVAVTHGVLLNNSVLRSGGHVVESGPGVLVQMATSTTVSHNTIEDWYYTGVSSGWTWSYVPTSNRDITIASNVIRHIGKARSDMGCIYVLGDSPQSFITGNVCSDVVTYSYGGNGLYTDQASRGYVFRNNIVHTVKCAPLLQHFGIDNVFENNVFAFPVQAAIDTHGSNGGFCGIRTAQAASGWEGISSFTFRHNVVLLGNASATMLCENRPGGFANMTLDANCYWNTAEAPGDIAFPTFSNDRDNTSFAAWQAHGKDRSSRIADPMFEPSVNPLTRFNKMDPRSQCRSIFNPIDTARAGSTLA